MFFNRSFCVVMVMDFSECKINTLGENRNLQTKLRAMETFQSAMLVDIAF